MAIMIFSEGESSSPTSKLPKYTPQSTVKTNSKNTQKPNSQSNKISEGNGKPNRPNSLDARKHKKVTELVGIPVLNLNEDDGNSESGWSMRKGGRNVPILETIVEEAIIEEEEFSGLLQFTKEDIATEYILLELMVILLEAALVAFIGIDRRWEKDLPFDQTGELDNLKSFFEKYADICKWIGIALLTVQALSLLLSLVLRAMISTRANSDVENAYLASEDRIREPLLISQPHQSVVSSKSDNRGTLADVFATRMRQKYRLKDESSGLQSPSASSSPRA